MWKRHTEALFQECTFPRVFPNPAGPRHTHTLAPGQAANHRRWFPATFSSWRSVDRPEQKDQTVNQSPQLSSSEISSLTRLSWSSTASSLLNNPITGFLQKHSQQCLLSAHSLLIKPKAWRCLKEVDRIGRLWQLPVLWDCRRRAACVLRQLVQSCL